MKKIFVFPEKFSGIFLISITVIGIGLSVFFYLQYRHAQNVLNNPTAAGQVEAKDLVKKISRIMVLPDREIPTVATVSDVSKLKSQQFFHNSKNGDKLLIFPKAKVAVLYSPKLDKIINVGPLNIGQTPQSATGGETNATPIRIALYNGTDTAGLTSTIEKELQSKFNNISVSIKENAKNKHTKTLVVDLSGNQKATASNIAKQLDGEVGLLPIEEANPAESDILVILGK